MHTKGPWFYYNETEEGPTHICSQGDVDIATIPAYVDQEERVANASLMSAAPELLELCKGSLNVFLDNCGCGHCGPCKISRDLKGIINKAEGN